jgi:hypothetical protein
MEANTADIGKMEFSKEMESFSISMDQREKERLAMVKNMGHQFIQTQMEPNKDRYGD